MRVIKYNFVILIFLAVSIFLHGCKDDGVDGATCGICHKGGADVQCSGDPKHIFHENCLRKEWKKKGKKYWKAEDRICPICGAKIAFVDGKQPQPPSGEPQQRASLEEGVQGNNAYSSHPYPDYEGNKFFLKVPKQCGYSLGGKDSQSHPLEVGEGLNLDGIRLTRIEHCTYEITHAAQGEPTKEDFRYRLPKRYDGSDTSYEGYRQQREDAKRRRALQPVVGVPVPPQQITPDRVASAPSFVQVYDSADEAMDRNQKDPEKYQVYSRGPIEINEGYFWGNLNVDLRLGQDMIYVKGTLQVVGNVNVREGEHGSQFWGDGGWCSGTWSGAQIGTATCGTSFRWREFTVCEGKIIKGVDHIPLHPTASSQAAKPSAPPMSDDGDPPPYEKDDQQQATPPTATDGQKSSSGHYVEPEKEKTDGLYHPGTGEEYYYDPSNAGDARYYEELRKAGVPNVPKAKKRNIWQRNAPTWLGGKPSLYR